MGLFLPIVVCTVGYCVPKLVIRFLFWRMANSVKHLDIHVMSGFFQTDPRAECKLAGTPLICSKHW